MKLNGKKYSDFPKSFWIGMTDFLDERRTNRSNWRLTDGALNPLSSKMVWHPSQPNGNNQDCVRQCSRNGEVCDTLCNFKCAPMCQSRPEPSSLAREKNFQAIPVRIGLQGQEFAEYNGCSKLLTNVESEISCAVLCSGDPKDWCVSFYFSEAKRECRLVLYTDAHNQHGHRAGIDEVRGGGVTKLRCACNLHVLHK